MIVASLWLACRVEDPEGPSIEILHPQADDALAVGPFSVTVQVENFVLVDPAKHTEREPEGFISVALDGAEVLTTADTTFPVSTDAMGTYALSVALRYADGDAIDPPVSDAVTLDIE